MIVDLSHQLEKVATRPEEPFSRDLAVRQAVLLSGIISGQFYGTFLCALLFRPSTNVISRFRRSRKASEAV